MSSSIDYFYQRSKRKLEDYDYEEEEEEEEEEEDEENNSLVDHPHPFFQPRAVLSDRIHFFVRMISGGKTLVLHGRPDDKIKLIHDKIQSVTGIPVIEQRLIYRGRQLQWDDTLDDCLINNDAEMHLVGRMRSTKHPQVWQLIDDLVSTIYRLCKGQDLLLSSSLNSVVKSRLLDFLRVTAKKDIDEYHLVSHLNIFQSLCAPKALVMLYMSPHKGNKECAESSIRNFIDSNTTMLPKPLYSQCAPLVLDFCKLLNTAAAQDDPLYDLCRTSLGSIVVDLRIGRTLKNHNQNHTHNNTTNTSTTAPTCSYNKSSMISVEDIFPFVTELANKLTQSLNITSPSPSDVCDFAAFLRPIKAAIKDLPDFGGIIPVPMVYTFPCYDDEIKLLFMILFEMLEKVRKCLQQMEVDLAMEWKGDGGWDQYLAILKELRGIAKLYQGAEDIFWSDMKAVKVSFCYLIIKYAKRGKDYKWIRRHKDILDFESRRHLVMMLLPDVKDEYEDVHEMLIDRFNLLAESFEYIAKAEPETLLGGLFMGFKNEEATGPGVLREWFFLVCQEIFNPQNALFVACPNDRRRFFPNPASKVDPLHLQYFKFAGRVIALALMHKIQVGIFFDRAFFKQLSGTDICLEDIKDADPYLYSSCKQILDMDPVIVDEDALGLTFVHEIEELGSMKVVELFANGDSIVVNSRNREEYVNLLIQYRFVKSVTDQVNLFAQGFADIVGEKKIQKLFFSSLEVEDLDGILHGSETSISVEDWKAHTEYNGYKETDPQICWFWKIVGEMTAKQQKVLLFFWTSLKHLPVEGFSGLASELHIYKSNESIDLLPSSHTCFYRICFPPYPSMAVMQCRLDIITQEHVGCSFGTW